MDVTRSLGPAESHAEDVDTNAATSAALADPETGWRWLIKCVAFSADRAPVSPVEVTVLSGSTVLRRYELSANAFSPIEIGYGSGLACANGEIASIACPAGGASVKVAIAISGTLVRAA